MKGFLLRILFAVRNILEPLLRFQETAVLCYHSISNDEAATTVTPQQFEKQLRALQGAGYSFISLTALLAWYDNKVNDMPRKVACLTFDDGYADFETTALPILEKFNAPATLFVIGDREKYKTHSGIKNAMLSNDSLKRIRKHVLVTVGWHTKTHPHLAHILKEGLVKEITPDTPMDFFAYPGGNYSNAAISAVERAGFTAAFSIKRDLVLRGKSRWLLPRFVVLKHDTPRDVLRMVSMAGHWYAVLRSQFKKYA